MNAEIAARERALLALRARCDEALGVLADETDPRVPDLGAHSEAINELIAELAELAPPETNAGAPSDQPIPPSPWPLRHGVEWPLVVMDLVAGYDVAIAGHRELVARSESLPHADADRAVRVLLRQVRRLETLREYMETAIGDYEEATMTRHTGEIPTIASGTLAS
jgi:hypothetical protein